MHMFPYSSMDFSHDFFHLTISSLKKQKTLKFVFQLKANSGSDPLAAPLSHIH